MWSTPRTFSWLLGLVTVTVTVGQCLTTGNATMANIKAAVRTRETTEDE
jgi:hypothetical protein